MAPPRLDAALRRLSAALDQLEAVGERLSRSGAEKRDLADGLVLMQEDRAQLAETLDAALTRQAALERVMQDVSHRLGSAGVTLRRFLAAEPAGPEA
jgi:chromosome segregation ATPase